MEIIIHELKYALLNKLITKIPDPATRLIITETINELVPELRDEILAGLDKKNMPQKNIA